MTKILLSLFVAFTLLLAPMAHAFEWTCEGDGCQMSEQVKKTQTQDNQQDTDKMAGVDHHCCCTHVSANINAELSAPEDASSQAAFSRQDIFMSSVVQGPPLKPPSHGLIPSFRLARLKECLFRCSDAT
ncbi:MAG: hypothetical protein EBR02_00690 [Alphaproteobacteria bacterium]|nr:hypothetical protein [Alphaproteobacteria bacterium]